MAEKSMERNSEERKIKKKVYHVLVETLQNINKHSDDINEQIVKGVGSGLFMIGQKDDQYFVITANKVHKNKREGLQATIDEVNNSTPEELKEMYKKQIKEGSISDRGGAGLGLIDIARKTGKELEFQFSHLDEEYYFFLLKVEIPSV